MHINQSQYFEGVSTETGNCTIGGHKPAEKRLKDLKDRTLTHDDAQHYVIACATLSEKLTAMAKIDRVIDGYVRMATDLIRRVSSIRYRSRAAIWPSQTEHAYISNSSDLVR